jgi:hypothetical protein
MPGLTVELNKTYVISEVYRWGTMFRIVKVVGEVLPESIEYQGGGRFYADDGVILTTQGLRLVLAKDSDNNSVYKSMTNPENASIRLAVREDLISCTHDRYRIDFNEENPPACWIPTTHPSFIMRLGGVYADRMGCSFMIAIMRYDEDDSDTRFIEDTIAFEKVGFEKTGKFYTSSELISMRDIVYMREY